MGNEATKQIRACFRVALGFSVATLLSACVPSETTSTSQQRPVVAAEMPAPILASALASASPTVQHARLKKDRFQYRAARSTVRAGLKGIALRYINFVEMDELALDGLRGLATIDPAFQLVLEDGMIRVNLDEDNIADFARPLSRDPADWARLTTEIVRAGRNRSPEFQEADNERIYEALFDGMLAGLDIFSRYSGADEARANRARRDGFGGIGIRFTKAENAILVTHVQDGGPAHGAGLRPGDLILKINKDATGGLSLRKTAQRLRGPVGSPLTLSIARLNSDVEQPDRHISFNLKRAHIVPETVRASVKGDVLKLTVTGFNKNTAPSMHAILSENDAAFHNGKLSGVVMDLRGNPGGLLSQSVDVADLFLNRGRIIATRGRHPDSFHDYRAGGGDLIDGKPLIVLVDGDSASAAEIVASALQDLGRAVVVGSSSYGKGTVQTVIRLPNDGEMTLTWSRLVSPSGYALHGLGVMPAVCATNTPAGDTQAILAPAHIDSQLEAMSAWRAAGMIFDGRRPQLRDSCPAKTFQAGKNGDLLMQLARQVIHDPSLYRRALLLTEPINTASRH